MYVNGIVIQKYVSNSYKGIDGSGFSENTGRNWYFNYDEQLSDLFEPFYDEHIGMTYRNLKKHSWVAACNNMDYIISYIAESKKRGIQYRLLLCESDVPNPVFKESLNKSGAQDAQSDFFVRSYENDAAGLTPGKEFSCKITEKMQADCVPSRQAGFIQWFLNVSELKTKFLGYDYAYATGDNYSAVYNEIPFVFPQFQLNCNGLFDTEEKIKEYILERERFKKLHPPYTLEEGDFIIFRLHEVYL